MFFVRVGLCYMSICVHICIYVFFSFGSAHNASLLLLCCTPYCCCYALLLAPPSGGGEPTPFHCKQGNVSGPPGLVPSGGD